jgi:hypothetical protein
MKPTGRSLFHLLNTHLFYLGCRQASVLQKSGLNEQERAQLRQERSNAPVYWTLVRLFRESFKSATAAT